MHNLDFIQNFRAQGQILAKRIVKHGTEDRTATTAVDGAAPCLGISVQLKAEDGGRVDVARNQVAEVEYGATVTRGQRLKADAQGRAVPAAAGEFYVGTADVSGTTGDIGECFINPGQEQ